MMSLSEQSKRIRWTPIVGPGLAFVSILLMEALAATPFQILNPAAILLLIVVLAALVAGHRSGLATGAIGWLYLAYRLSEPGDFFRFSSENLSRLLIWTVTIPTTAVIVGLLRKRLNLSQLRQRKAQKESDARIRTDELRIQSILDTAYDAFVAIDSHGAIIDWNRQAESTFGWKRSEVVGRLVSDVIIPHRYREDHRRGLRRFMETEEGPIINRRLELSALHRDGYELPVELTVSPVKLENGYIFGAFLHDITERKRSDQLETLQLAVTRILYDADSIAAASDRVLEAVCRDLEWDIGAMWMLDTKIEKLIPTNTWHAPKPALTAFAEATRSYAFTRGQGLPGRVWESGNPAWIVDATTDPNFPRGSYAAKGELHGAFAFPIWTGTEFIGVVEFLSQKFRQPDPKLLEVMSDIGMRMGLFVARKRAEDELRQLYQELEEKVQARSKELSDKNHALAAEVQEHKQTHRELEEREADLLKAKDAAEAANRAKSAFLANMSHEIRTPLGVVLGFSELLLNPNLSASERVNAMQAIKRNGELLSNIISDILDLSKVEAGKLAVEKAETSIAELVTDLTALLNLQATEKGLRLTVASEGGIPDAIVTDPLRLRQILINIVGNAIKFTKRGSVDVTIKLEAPAEGAPKLAFVVKDTGPGIPAERRRQIFESFTQADASTTRRFGGSGLGLPLAKRLAQLLGGDVVLFESTEGAGTTFVITI